MFNYKMSENPLEFGMVCVVVKLTLCYVFQRVLFFLSCTKVLFRGMRPLEVLGGEVMDLLAVKEDVG